MTEIGMRSRSKNIFKQEEIETLELIFYGTSGWFESESGCTSCTGVFLGDRDLVLFDLGTGVRKIKKESIRNKNVTVVLSHLHLDHCYGLHILPMFQPASLTIVIHESLEPYLDTLFAFPFVKPREKLGFPTYIRGVNNTILDFDDFAIETKTLKHNTPIIGARLHCNNTSISYCVDSSLCDSLLDLSQNCGMLIIESSPLAGKKNNGFHLTLDGLKEVLETTHADRVVITHFGVLKYPDPQSKTLLFEEIKSYHRNIIMAYDGLVMGVKL